MGENIRAAIVLLVLRVFVLRDFSNFVELARFDCVRLARCENFRIVRCEVAFGMLGIKLDRIERVDSFPPPFFRKCSSFLWNIELRRKGC